jgi:hypothetical protein
MIDNTPYIIVDNQKISPIERAPRSDSPTADRKEPEEHTFGVVDRVTISREAREKSMQPSDHAEADPLALEARSKKPTATHPQLTYSPKQRR